MNWKALKHLAHLVLFRRQLRVELLRLWKNLICSKSFKHLSLFGGQLIVQLVRLWNFVVNCHQCLSDRKNSQPHLVRKWVNHKWMRHNTCFSVLTSWPMLCKCPLVWTPCLMHMCVYFDDTYYKITTTNYISKTSLYITFCMYSSGPWPLKILMFALLVTREIATYSWPW
jgi:hypothetical protein